MRSDDLAPLLLPEPPDPTALRGGKGTVIEWDPLTAENVIRWRGTELVNVPIVASSSEVLMIKPGDEVVLHIFGAGGWSTVYIVGRITQPGTPQAASFFELFGFQTATEAAEGDALNLYSSLGDLQSPANPGPAVTVNVGRTGRALVLIQVEIVSLRNTIGFGGGNVGIQLSGANTVAASDKIGFAWNKYDEVAGPAVESWMGASANLYTGLNAGSTTFTLKYGRSANDCDTSMKNRTIMVLPV